MPFFVDRYKHERIETVPSFNYVLPMGTQPVRDIYTRNDRVISEAVYNAALLRFQQRGNGHVEPFNSELYLTYTRFMPNGSRLDTRFKTMGSFSMPSSDFFYKMSKLFPCC